jgi:Tfp pilus assembly major pilin PilA
MTFGSKSHQRGVSLVGLIFVLAILAMIAVLAMKVVPTVIEYNSIRKAIMSAKGAGETVREIQNSFDKQAEVGYIESISGKDLEITKNGSEIDVSFAYQKKIPLFGPASLVIDYAGSTAKTAAVKPANE